MKKFSELLKPFYSIILGALMLLFYMNWLQGGGSVLALGIIAMVLAAYYIGIGILAVVMGDKITAATRGVLDSLSVLLFPLFMFVFFLLSAIGGGLNPTGWVIIILGMVTALGFIVLYILSVFGKNDSLKNLTRLFAFTFILSLLLSILLLFGDGTLGGIDIVQFAICFIFSTMLISAVQTADEAPKSEEPPKSEE